MSLHALSAVFAAAGGGCHAVIPEDLKPGKLTYRTLRQEDTNPILGTYERQYTVRLPEGFTGAEPLPLLFWLHGWGEDYTWDGHFKRMADEHNYIIVKPNGMTDGQKDMRSWNVVAGRDDICSHRDVTEYEYSSCRLTNQTSICNAGTCYDDVKFHSDLYALLRRELCIDEERVFMSGGSFGGLFSYYAPPRLQRLGSPLRPRAILPWYGAFYRHTLDVPKTLAGTSVFHFHGIMDTEVPMNSSESGDGYYYVPTTETLARYAQVNDCDRRPTPIFNKHDGHGRVKTGRLRGCVEWLGCSTGARVVLCDFDGEHGIWPAYAEELMASFLATLGPAPARFV